MKRVLSVGWKEWGALPEIGIRKIHIKVDTGAKTSAIHCLRHELFEKKNQTWVRFWTLPKQDSDQEVCCEAPLVDERTVKSSGGHATHRLVVKTKLRIGDKLWPIELTLADRSVMKFRMLLGREGMKDITVHPSQAHIQGIIAS